MNTVTFRATTAQLRNLVLATCASGVIAAVLLHEHLAGHDANGRVLGSGIAAAFVMLLTAGVAFAYSRAVTECTETGIRMRGLGLERRWRWDQISELSVRIGSRGVTRTVMLALTDGSQVLLGAPVTGGLMPDRDFERKAAEIHDFWRRATGGHSAHGGVPVVPPASYRSSRRSVLVGLVTLAALGLTAALPVIVREGGPALLVRLGQGQSGYFTGYYLSCSPSCAWVGDFVASGSPVRRDSVTIASGASIPPSGGRVAAVDTGSAGLVYPAGGGTGWIPLVTALAVLAACLGIDALWMTSRIRLRRAERQRQPGRDPPAAAVTAAPGPAGRALAGRPATARTAVTTGAVCAIVAGTVTAILLLPVPSAAPSAAARACADFSQWLTGQNGNTQPWTDQAALARGAQVAPDGVLSGDLAALASEVSAAAQLGQSSAAAAALVGVAAGIRAVSHDCFG